MAGTLRIAWRNLGRNRRRTFITGLALAIGTTLSVAAYGWVDGLVSQLFHSLTRLDLGHVQVHHPDYPRTRSSEHAIKSPDTALATARGIDAVDGVAPRVYAFALVSSQGKSLGVELAGVDPAAEPRVTVMHEKVKEGRYLDITPTPWPRGRTLTQEELARDNALTEEQEKDVLEELEALEELGTESNAPGQTPGPDAAQTPKPDTTSAQKPDAAQAPGSDAAAFTRELALAQSPPPERPPRVLVGASLARILDVGVGDRLHATTQTTDGQNEEVFVEIGGIFRTGTAQLDRSRMYMHIADLQRFIHLYDQVHEIALVARKAEDADAAARQLHQALDAVGGEQALLVRSWKEIRPDMHRMLEVSRSSSVIMIFIIFFVATLGVVNTMLMAVFERTRELGVLKAIGMSGGRIVLLIVTETLFLVLISAAVGTLLGLGLDLYMVEHGIDLSSVTGGLSIGRVGIDPVIHGAITPRGVILPTVLLSVMCFVASLYPAIRAARLRPAVGMRET